MHMNGDTDTVAGQIYRSALSYFTSVSYLIVLLTFISESSTQLKKKELIINLYKEPFSRKFVVSRFSIEQSNFPQSLGTSLNRGSTLAAWPELLQARLALTSVN